MYFRVISRQTAKSTEIYFFMSYCCFFSVFCCVGVFCISVLNICHKYGESVGVSVACSHNHNTAYITVPVYTES